MNDATPQAITHVDLKAEYEASGVAAILDELEHELIGLQPVKQRIREVAALLIVERARKTMGLSFDPPTLHMSFTGNPGTGKTTLALRMANILHRLGYVRKGHLVSVTRDDLVGQYIGHTAPKTKEVLKRAMGGVLFIDEAYYLYRPDNERDYGQEAIEILLQVMENNREDLVVILAGYADRMDMFFQSNPGFRSRIAHHIDFLIMRMKSYFQFPKPCSRDKTTTLHRMPKRPWLPISRHGADNRISRMPVPSAMRLTARGFVRQTVSSQRHRVLLMLKPSRPLRLRILRQAACSRAASNPGKRK